MKTNQKGFSVVEVIVVIVVVGLLAAVGWLVYDRQNNKSDTNAPTSAATQQEENQETANESAEVADPYKGWKSGSFKFAKLTYKIPPDWQDISDDSKFQDGSTKYEEVRIKADDGFNIWMSVNNLPRGYEGGAINDVLDFKEIDDGHQWIIANTTGSKVDSIYVGDGAKKGEKIYPVANVSKDGFNIEIIGSYSTALNSLAEFNMKQSVKDAKLVFESLEFN